MKKSNFFISIFIIGLSLSFSACDSGNKEQEEGTDLVETEGIQTGTEGENNQGGGLIEVMRSRQDLSTFLSLVESARMVETLEAAGPFTVFAPSNDAFNKLPAGRLEQLRNQADQETKNIISHHMMSRRLLEDDIKKGTRVDVLGGQNLTLKTENGTTMLENARVNTQGIPAGNGVIYIIDQVLIPQNTQNQTQNTQR